MKKHLSIILSLCLVLSYSAGCSANNDIAAIDSDSNVEIVSGSVSYNASGSGPDSGFVAGSDASIGSDYESDQNSDPELNMNDNVDAQEYVDFTRLSGIMRTATFHVIMMNPDDYIGKTIRVNGSYLYMFDDATGLYYHFVMGGGGDNCCGMGFEIRLSGDFVFPDDYPDINAMIDVTGVLNEYEELGRLYLYLAIDDITVLND